MCSISYKNQRKNTNHQSANEKKSTRVFNEAERKFSQLPSSALFKQFIEELIEKYDLQSIVEKNWVSHISYNAQAEYPFYVTLADGEVALAKSVIHAGNQGKCRIPTWASPYLINNSHLLLCFIRWIVKKSLNL